MARKPKTSSLNVETLTHDEATRKNIPTAEYQSMMRKDEQAPVRVTYARGPAEQPDALAHEKGQRNRDLDPQLIWRGKDQQDWSDLVVHAPPLYIQEKVHPKALIDDLRRVTGGQSSVASEEGRSAGHRPLDTGHQLDLFADFNGIPKDADKTEFYRHDQNWSNRMILGDSLQVMASLAEREGLRGKVQCIYIDPPYGIKFNSNFQWSTTSRDVKDGNVAHITREPEQVKAFRDTWRDGIHSYLTYLRDRLTVARDLLSDSGSIFVQIGDENVHRVRAVMDEVFGENNLISEIVVQKTYGFSSDAISNVSDFVLFYAKRRDMLKVRPLFREKPYELGKGNATWLLHPDFTYRGVNSFEKDGGAKIPEGAKPYNPDNLLSQGRASEPQPFEYRGVSLDPFIKSSHWKSNYPAGMNRLLKAERIHVAEKSFRYRRYHADFAALPYANIWTDTGTGNFTDDKIYVVQTGSKTVERCILMATDPGDLVLDPTCGSGTTAYVAEQWGRRWITIDTSRVALALARARIMGARYPYYLLADSPAGQLKEAEVTRSAPSSQPTRGDIRHGFVYERVPHITLKSIANNAEIDVIWDHWQKTLEPLRETLNAAMGKTWEEWEIPRVAEDLWPAEPLRFFKALQVEQAKGANASPAKIDDALLGINKALERDYSIETLPDRPVDLWAEPAATLHADWWKARIARQTEIDASIAAKADSEYLYDKPYTDKKTVRVSGPFTVESLSPHRVLGVDENDELIDPANSVASPDAGYGEKPTFSQMILDNLKVAGVQQAHKDDKIIFTSLTPWPGDLICAEGRYVVGDEPGILNGDPASPEPTETPSSITEKRAAIFIGPEFGTVTRPDLVLAAREAGEADFDVLIACAFNYEAHATEFNKLGRIPVLKARMNADLHMAEDLKTTTTGNLFVIFGEPDISVTSGRWLVTSDGRVIANYEQCQELSGFGSLEEINRAGRAGLSVVGKVSTGGKVRADQSDPTSLGLSGREHRGGGGAGRNEGVPSFSGDREWIACGDGDVPDSLGATGVGTGSPYPSGVGTDRGRWSTAQRTQALAALQALTEGDFPLALTTDHRTQVTIHGVDVFHPGTGEVRSDGPEGIACWFIDTDYNEESFFVRHAYFLGAEDPYKALKTTLKAEIDEDAWASLNSDTSRPFPKPASGRIAVKVINHLGDEVMKVFRI